MKIVNHDMQSKMGNMIKEWVVFNKLEDFNSLLKYTDDDFTPTGKLCCINAKVKSCIENLWRNLPTSDDILNIFLMNMNINMMI